ncbi:uncharacterized protein LOC128549491 isoform X2 [Mercenaria mercenaria]|uniref:uncharacterized protein LOC128549491 isoform X2 n=1 Tax=Mercenaria mercenaria TaxID=6596 RepID=UPI00234F335F|nr:uncharacterized protein LOC128549491 isoform X2 [Mercenaria mercenaria]
MSFIANFNHIRFDDPQSGIDHYDMCIGTKPGSCDILPNMNCLLQSNVIKTGLSLPPKTTLYAMVTAYNRVRLNVTQISDSFYVDATPPLMSIKPRFLLENNNIPGKKGQWEKSVIKVYWKFNDDESPITHHAVTLMTHHEGHTPVEHVRLGSENELTIHLDGKSWLHNGDKYFVTVTSCNLAGLCSSERSDDILIDSTPPHLGGFKPPMVWENLNSSFGELKSNITLTWYGFHDQESDIKRYYITVSKTYSGNELTKGVSTVNADGSEIDRTYSFLLHERLKGDDTLFLTIWAENSVGLNSSLARVSVTVLSSSSSLDNAKLKGPLELEKHSCDIQYCNKDCTCAVIGRPCVEEESAAVRCKELNETLMGQAIPDVEVFNGMNEKSLNITASSACLTGSWRVNEGMSNKTIKRFEWSMGLQDQPVGEGVFDLKNKIPWNDVGLQKQIVHCLPENRTLIARETYVIYVRAWFSRNTFAIYRSAPIKVDQTAPSIGRGRTVIDSNELCNVDFDVIDWMDTITACWSDVFFEHQGHIIYYMISLGTYPFGDDSLRRINVGLNTSITLTNISLSHGTKYFFSVTAYNNVGLHSSALSDGFVIDMDIPATGVVFNSLKHRNTAYQSSVSSIGISWHGFQDAFSGIQNYHAAISDMPYENESMNTINTGLQTSYLFQNLALEHGKTYYGLVKAVDKVGHVSALAVSKGVFIDTTAPVGYRCEKYTDIGQISKTTNGNDETLINIQHTFSLKKLYKVIVNLVSVDDNRPKLKIHIGRFQIYLPAVEDHNRVYHFKHSFFASFAGLQNISLKLENDDQGNKTVSLNLFECSQVIEDSNEAIQLTQISRSKIAVQVLVTDEDSSLRKIELGAGTTVDGFQIKPLSTFYHKHNIHMIYTHVPHGTQVFVTAIAENKAGLRSVFHSRSIIVDHTSPVFNHLVGHIQNVQVNLSGVLEIQTIVQATWDVVDEESGIKQCYCSVGHEPGLFDIQSIWTSQLLTHCESNKLQLSHGQRLHLNLKCINNIQLSTKISTDPLVASIQKPNAYTAVLDFVPQNEESSEYVSQVGSKFPVQSNHTCLSLKWHGFQDLSGIDHYEYRLSKTGPSLSINWTETDRDVIQVADVNVESGEITAEVRAINKGSFKSEAINASIVVARYAPRFTGRTAKIKRRGNSLNVSWADVFQSVEGMPLSYSLMIGTRKGYADVLDMNYITSMEYDVSVPDSTIITPNLKEVFVRITCIYATGLRASYYTNYKM